MNNAEENWRLLPEKRLVMSNEKSTQDRKFVKARLVLLAGINPTGDKKIRERG